MFGRPLIFLILLIFVAVCVFILAQWAIPLLFGFVDVTIPSKVVNVLALLIAIGVLYGGWTRNVVTG
jgi:hypothetical protein